jgi:hypothetical protein
VLEVPIQRDASTDATAAKSRRAGRTADLVTLTVAQSVAQELRDSLPPALWEDVLAQLRRELGFDDTLFDPEP